MARGLVSRTLHSALIVAATLATAFGAAAEDYPTRTVRIVSPHPVGVATDILARALAVKLSESTGQPFVVENRPGANGIVATGNIAKAAPDGYTILITTGAHIANAFVAKDLPYDVIKDFAPGTELAASYGLALITNLPVNSVPELVALARSKPGQLTYATNGIGNITHVAGLLFDARTGTQMVPVQYNTPQLTADVISGTVNMTFFSVAAAAPLVKSGQIKALAVTGSRRSPSLPDTPTLQELGYKDYDVTGYFGLLFPMGTPRERIDRIHREALKALETPEVRRVIDAGGFYAVGGAPERFAAFLKQDYDHQNRLMTELGLKAK
jgi:tripartite-type tricarboxylate transporter receptor subunit TctC